MAAPHGILNWRKARHGCGSHGVTILLKIVSWQVSGTNEFIVIDLGARQTHTACSSEVTPTLNYVSAMNNPAMKIPPCFQLYNNKYRKFNSTLNVDRRQKYRVGRWLPHTVF